MQLIGGGGRGGLGGSYALVRHGERLELRARSRYRRGWDSVDVDGGGDGSAAYGFTRGQETDRQIFPCTLGLVEREIG